MTQQIASMTIDALVQSALEIEQLKADFYHSLAQKFSHDTWLTSFWNDLSTDESLHLRWLSQVRELVSSDKLFEPAPARLVGRLGAGVGFSIEEVLSQISSLDDAYQAALTLEMVEIGNLLDYLYGLTQTDMTGRIFLRRQFEQHHQQCLSHLPAVYPTRESRRAVLAL